VLNGFEYRSGDEIYLVCAPDLARARVIVAEKDEKVSLTEPETLPDQVLKFFGLKEGDMIVGRVIRNAGA